MVEAFRLLSKEKSFRRKVVTMEYPDLSDTGTLIGVKPN